MKTTLIFAATAIIAFAAGSLQKVSAQNTQPYWSLAGNSNATSNSKLGTVNKVPLRLFTNNIERVRIDTLGRVGIGIAAPAVKLHVTGGSDASLSKGGYIATGILTGLNMAIDDNEIMARNNGNTSPLYLNGDGGAIGFSNERVFIESVNGNLGVGTTTPATKLHIIGGTEADVSSGGYITVGLTTQSNIAIDQNEIMARTNGVADTLNLNINGGVVHTGGNLDVDGSNIHFGSAEILSDGGSNTIQSNSNFIPDQNCSRNLGSSSYRWDNIWSCNGVISVSDLNAKKNIRNMDYGIKEIMKLRTVKFNWLDNADQNDKLGLIAQELKQVLPEVVKDYEFNHNEQTGTVQKVPAAVMGVNYSEIIPVLIRSIQQQQEMIEELQKQLADLNANNPSAATGSPASANTAGAFASIKLMPNPARNTVTITGTETGSNIIITNLEGKHIMQQKVPGTSITVNISSFANGAYIVQYSNGKNNQTLRFIKQQ